MSMDMKMKNNYLLIQELEQEESKTASGIIIPVEKHNRKATVINAGDCKDVDAGDVILKNMGKGTMVTLNDTEFEVLHVNQIIAVIKDNG
jgi:co-chaperonin GroES (HSP10)